MRKLKTVLLDLKRNTIEVREIEDKLDAFYKALDVDLIELPIRSVGGKEYTIMCDEEGLFKDRPIVSCMSLGNEMNFICGSVMFFNDSGDGELESLTEDDIDTIVSHIRTVYDKKHPAGIHSVVIMD